MESAPIKTLMKLGEVINKSDITRPINSFLKYILLIFNMIRIVTIKNIKLRIYPEQIPKLKK